MRWLWRAAVENGQNSVSFIQIKNEIQIRKFLYQVKLEDSFQNTLSNLFRLHNIDKTRFSSYYYYFFFLGSYWCGLNLFLQNIIKRELAIGEKKIHGWYSNRRKKFPNYFKKNVLFHTRNIRYTRSTIKVVLLENTKMLQLQMTLTRFSFLETKKKRKMTILCSYVW